MRYSLVHCYVPNKLVTLGCREEADAHQAVFVVGRLDALEVGRTSVAPVEDRLGIIAVLVGLFAFAQHGPLCGVGGERCGRHHTQHGKFEVGLWMIGGFFFAGL